MSSLSSGGPGPFHAEVLKQGLLWRITWPMTAPWCLADYDAVLTEAGDYTKKYFKLRKLFGSILGTQQPFQFEGWSSS